MQDGFIELSNEKQGWNINLLNLGACIAHAWGALVLFHGFREPRTTGLMWTSLYLPDFSSSLCEGLLLRCNPFFASYLTNIYLLFEQRIHDQDACIKYLRKCQFYKFTHR